MINLVLLESIGWLIGGGLAVVGLLFGVHVAAAPEARADGSANKVAQMADALSRGDTDRYFELKGDTQAQLGNSLSSGDIGAAAKYAQQMQQESSGTSSGSGSSSSSSTSSGSGSSGGYSAQDGSTWISKAAYDNFHRDYDAEYAQWEKDMAAWEAQYGSGASGGSGGSAPVDEEAARQVVANLEWVAGEELLVIDAYRAALASWQEDGEEPAGRAWMQSLQQRATTEPFALYEPGEEADGVHLGGIDPAALQQSLQNRLQNANSQSSAHGSLINYGPDAAPSAVASGYDVNSRYTKFAESGLLELDIQSSLTQGKPLSLQVREWNSKKDRWIVQTTQKAKATTSGTVHFEVEAEPGNLVVVKKKSGQKIAEIPIPKG